MQTDFDDAELDKGSRLYGKRMCWFVVLWCGGFIATLLLSLPFKLLVNAAMR
jgi:hypothetical protein